MPHQVVLAAADGSAAVIDIHNAFVAHNRVPTAGSQLIVCSADVQPI